ncbi:MAG: DUF2752 domain-containing protein [Bdellovibrionales bacterium]|nr:DUF2752 domain-containing protein [Bdellovibrionales bacterium]
MRRKLAVFYLASILLMTFLFRSIEWTRIENVLSASPAQCPLKRFLGLKCAFCGMTHSWIAIFKGEWARAFQENLLGLPFLVGTMILALVVAIRPAAFKWSRPATVLSLAVLLSYAIARNMVDA